MTSDEKVADIRNALGSVQTLLDLIKEEQVRIKDPKLNKIFWNCVRQAGQAINRIKKDD